MRAVCVFLLVLLGGLSNAAYSGGAQACAQKSSRNSICNQSIMFSKPLSNEEQVSVRKAVNEVSEIFLTKNVDALINHENGAVKTSDQSSIGNEKMAFLFGMGPSTLVPRKSVRQIVLGSGKPAVYIEPHDVWEIYKGDLYVVIFYDANKISLKEISKDLGHDRHQYMSAYAATLIQLNAGTWLFPETPFFWETDGP